MDMKTSDTIKNKNFLNMNWNWESGNTDKEWLKSSGQVKWIEFKNQNRLTNAITLKNKVQSGNGNNQRGKS
jgi:hypothetical protein